MPRMSPLQAIVYGIVQGLTEFLPVSSSAHLLLVPVFTGWPDPGLAFNVALHWGTLLAVVGYFWRDVVQLVRSAALSFTPAGSPDGPLPWKIAAATVPGAALGYIFEDQVSTVLRSAWVVVVTLSLLAILLHHAEKKGSGQTSMERLTWPAALLIGFCQGLAIVPGVSRSGITITAGLFLGLQKTAAVRFSFLLSIPIIFGAGLLESPYILERLGDPMLWIALVSSALSGWAAIHLLLTYVRTRSFRPFVVYRFVLAAVIAGLLISRT